MSPWWYEFYKYCFILLSINGIIGLSNMFLTYVCLKYKGTTDLILTTHVAYYYDETTVTMDWRFTFFIFLVHLT
jgi:hypothetical protein